jgi:uncharacterized membrane protein YfcA
VIVASYMVRGGTGLGAAAAMPLLGLVVPIKVLVPVWTLLGMASSATILGRERRYVSVPDVLRMLPALLVGIAIGLYVFKTLDALTLARGLGLLVTAYGLYSLALTLRPSTLRRASPRFVAPVAGVLAGAVGTTFGTMASLFFTIYFDVRQLAKAQFRATMSAMILTLSTVRGLGYFAVGEFNRDVLIAFAAAFPLMLIGIFIGDRFHAGMSETTFRRVVSVVLIVSGIALLVK